MIKESQKIKSTKRTVAILTYYNVHNHGSSLQALAMKKVLQDLDLDVSFLNFDRNYDFISVEKKSKYQIGLRSIPFYLKYCREKGLSNIFFNLYKHSVLSKYTKQNINASKHYSEYDGDFVAIGSDEVFSLEVGVNPCLFGDGVPAKSIFSYAASFGPTTLLDVENKHLTEYLCTCLQKMNSIGVRDMNSKEMVKSISGCDAYLTCDPVILYGFGKEKNDFVPKNAGKYILIYSYDKNLNDAESIEAIRAFAKEKKLKIISVGYHHKWCDANICPDPIKLLGYFKNAAYVFTNTFHGAVISLITESQFFVKVEGNQNKLGYLMKEYNIEQRMVESFTQAEDLSSTLIDYQKVNEIMAAKKTQSMEYIKYAVRG